MPRISMMLFLIANLFAYSLMSNTSFEFRVIDEATKEPLAYANVTVVGTGTGSVTNIEGVFMLDLNSIESDKIVAISYIGYQMRKVPVNELKLLSEITMKQSALKLSEVNVPTKQLTAKQIMAFTEKNFETNYPRFEGRQRIFFHHIERTPSPGADGVKVKRSNFPGLDKEVMKEIMALIPSEFIEYQDAIVDLYTDSENSKLIPIQAISLEEGSAYDLQKELEIKLAKFMNDVDESKDNEDIYYKIKTGILSQKININDEEESSETHEKQVSDHVVSKTEWVKNDLKRLVNEYSNYESDVWEFITKRGRYNYSIEQVTMIDSLVVYEVKFSPQRKGLYEGSAFISTDDFALVVADFKYAQGKQDEKIQLLGIGHAMNFKGARVMFEKIKEGYVLKYINAQTQEYIGIDRTFSFIKKQRRFFIDKELAELKLDAELKIHTKKEVEILILDRQKSTNSEFEKIEEPEKMLYTKQLVYDPSLWNNQTTIAPTEGLKAFKRQ
jgi:hypothetical protein